MTTATNSNTSTHTVVAAGDMTRRMICGGVAGMVAKTATAPLERMKLLFQTGDAQTTNIITLYKSILQREGLSGLWAGNGANLLRIFPAKAVIFSTNDLYKTMLCKTLSNDQTNTVTLSFLAGGLAGMTASALTYPLDFARGRIAGKLKSQNKPKDYNGIFRTIALTIHDEGFLAIYRGIIPTLCGALPYEGIKFGTVGYLEYLYCSDEETIHSNSPFRKMIFGGMGGIMAGLLTYPNDTVRRLLQVQGSRGTKAQYNGYIDCVLQTYAKGGIQRFYRGLTINLLRMAPNAAVQFGTYELLKQSSQSYF